MSFYKNAEFYREKLETILTEEDMVLAVRENYPLTLIISRNQAPEAQMSFLDMTDGTDSAADFSLRFIFDIDGLEIQTNSRLRMTDELMNKLKGLAKKWHTAYIHAFFAERSMAAQSALLITKYDDIPNAADAFDEFMAETDGSGLLDDE